MFKIQCPKCNKSFLWTDEMPTQGKCLNPSCDWSYNIHKELGKNISNRETKPESKTQCCPFCQEEISSKFTICPHCSRVVLGNNAFRKSYFFLAVCLLLFFLSLIFKYWVK
ncbi:MAG: hypothetical protein NTW65_01250 [Deltaproteobacteria bacterium]|nr:hypothetical protein [Deltaproteobacteria bacterium]